MHLGHARTSLLTWLRARSLGGRIVMRIEDLDPPRVREGSAASILEDHTWLGLTWDEGPYYQGQRYARYEEALDRLDGMGLVYPCSCTRREIQQAVGNAPHGDDGIIYPGTCRPPNRNKPGRPAASRFIMPEPAPGFVDALQGEVPPGGARGDFVVRRSDGLWAYQLAVVVDDAEMGITEVVRGEDLLHATPRQLALYDALGWSRPAFVHVGLVHGPDGERLSKRHQSPPIRDLREAGVTPEALLGRLGHSLGVVPTTAAISGDDLLAAFRFERVHGRSVCMGEAAPEL